MNRLIIGNSLNVISTIENKSVEVAFLDPPFNTGKNFEHYRDRRTRDEWLKMMLRILIGVHCSLSDTGVVWVNLDEHMHAHCRLLLDDIFGEDCYVATVMWRKKYKASQSRAIHTVHNPILVYGRNPEWRRKQGLEPGYSHMMKYKNPDNDPYGRWRLTHNGSRTYLSELLDRGAMPDTWWEHDSSGYTELAVKEVREETGLIFSTPKPLALLRRILTISAVPGSVVLDPFAGSGTTLVVAEELGMDWIGIEESRDTVHSFIIPRLAKVNAHYSLEKCATF
jgi:adenine-specific DNA-methyltransferase